MKLVIYSEELTIPTTKQIDRNALQYLIDVAGLDVDVIIRKKEVRCLAPNREQMIALHAIINTLNEA